MASDTIRHYEITISFDLWKPQEQVSNDEIDNMMSLLREKKLLGHLGKVRSTLREIKEGPCTTVNVTPQDFVHVFKELVKEIKNEPTIG